MFEFLLGYDNEAIALIVKDHETVKELFDKYEKAESRREKIRLAATTVQELNIHAIIEEEIFYPAIRAHIDHPKMNEADEEHHVARILCAELSVMDGSEDHYDAKYKVLSENIRHHIKEEEHEILPKAKGLDLDFTALASKMQARKAQLKRDGLPTSLEDRMVRATRNNDTPARESHRTAPAKAVADKTKTTAVSKAPVKSASRSMMEAKGKTAGKVVPKKAKPGTSKKTAKPAAKSASKPKLKIVSHRAASAAKSVRKSAASTKKTRNKR